MSVARFNVVPELPKRKDLEYCEMAAQIGCTGCSSTINIRAFGDRKFRDGLTNDLGTLSKATDTPIQVIRETRVDTFGPAQSDTNCEVCPIVEADGLVEEYVVAQELRAQALNT